MAWNKDPGPDAPVTPHAAPSLDQTGQLTYIGEDGRRYVVGLPPEMDQGSLERVMRTIQQQRTLFHQIETLACRWIEQVSGSELDGRAVLDERRDVLGDVPRLLVLDALVDFQDRFIHGDQHVNLVNVQRGVAVRARHVRVDLGDDERGVC